jgi:hypothetical protein
MRSLARIVVEHRKNRPNTPLATLRRPPAEAVHRA